MSVLAIIQARMGSTRLPGKSMMPLAGVPLIEHVVKRVQAAKLVWKVVVATTDEPEDDVLAEHCKTLGVDVYRGSSDNVLRRFYFASLAYPQATAILRVTADDPVVDPTLIDYLLTAFIGEWGEENRKMLPPPHYMELGGLTWPQGIGFAVFTRLALEAAYRCASSPYDLEHVVPWMQREYGCWQLKDSQARSSINTRLTIDTAEDYALACHLYDTLYATNPLFGYDDVLGAL